MALFSGMPSNLAKRRKTIGSSMKSTASAAGGRTPWTTEVSFEDDCRHALMPLTGAGSLQSQASHEAFSQR